LSPTLSFLVCRGCCCGTESKHPGLDHQGQVERLRAALPTEIPSTLREVDCLGECSSSNVIVVRRGQNRRWFGEMLGPERTEMLAEWIRGGANDVLKEALAAQEFSPEVV
jgi:predicted metal-binding protein